jgi:homoserine O-acetyltransferase/O-succinyltransferase
MRTITGTTRLALAGLLLATPAPALAQGQQFAELGACTLESGEVLRPCTVGYRTWGRLNAARDNAILVPTWYGGRTEQLAGTVLAVLDTNAFFVIGVDAFGNGVSTSPSNSPTQGGRAFPRVTIGDMVASQHRLVTEVLKLDRLYAVMGSSMGGMQTFEWAVAHPGFFRKGLSLIGSPRSGAYDIALWRSRIRLLDWLEQCRCEEAAEAVVMLFTLTTTTPDFMHRRTPPDSFTRALGPSAAANLRRDAGWRHDMAVQAYAIEHHDVTRRYGGDPAQAAARITAELLSIVVSSDHMVTPGPSVDFMKLLGAKGRSIVLQNDCGHGGLGCSPYLEEARAFLRRE